ncbi:SOS response-associated peptidase [Alkalicoccobacillus porphyridii]|uniref:Abasic site processing protein n=2 Tax=Alkalicoccobacillus porphyridii TaxID=2597270 RepID=A0A553ZZE6_9BACI|nr:SOS response-associated peptidase [Alkalicoccobacillus porphyridii]
MCGRFTLFTRPEKIMEELGIQIPLFDPSYNVAPSQNILSVAANSNGTRAGFLKWGLVPSWAKDKKIGPKLINARAETIAEKPAFKSSFYRRRCLIIADSFYEWKRTGNEKRPYRIVIGDEDIITFAGLWDRWTDGEEQINSCTIITTHPNQTMLTLHDRMPVILDKKSREVWLDSNVEDPSQLQSLLTPFQGEMNAYQVSRAVNNPRQNNVQLLRPV